MGIRAWPDACRRQDMSEAVRASGCDVRAIARWHTAFPDYCDHVENLVAVGRRGRRQHPSTGAHDGVFHWLSYGPWPGTAKRISMREIFFMRMTDEKITEVSATWNPNDLRQQLVALPQTSAAS